MNRKISLLGVGVILAGILPGLAQDSGPLIDKLVEKGILTDQEAEDIRADLVKDFASTSAGKLNFSQSITELKLSGDARYRYQYDTQKSQVRSNNNESQRSRHRFRLRLFADAKFTDNFFGGFGLETGEANDSANQTVDPVYSDSDIYISKVFLGYKAGDWGTFVLGKQKNPFYSTELVWDPDINPFGLTESVSLHQLFGYQETYTPGAASVGKDGKTAVPAPGITTSSGINWGKFELTFVAGQFIYSTDNTTISSTNEAESDSDAATDVYQFQQQVVATYNFDTKTALTVAPSFIFYNAGDIQDISSSDNAQGFGDASGISGESRDLMIVDIPGEFKFPVGSLNARLIWDFAWNVQGADRFKDVYQIDPDLYSQRDSFAWLLGVEIGQGKGKGAWTLAANYREVGISSIDPNLNDSDFALSRLNIRGFKGTATYWLTDFVSLAASAQIAYNLDNDLYGGNATSGENLADRNAVDVYQFDVNWKF